MGQSISQLLLKILFSILSVPESLGHRSGSLCARLHMYTKMQCSSIQETYILDVRQGSKCIRTIRHASGNREAIASWQRWGCPKYTMRMVQPKKYCPEAELIPCDTDISARLLLELFVCFDTITSKLMYPFGYALNFSWVSKTFQELFLWFSYWEKWDINWLSDPIWCCKLVPVFMKYLGFELSIHFSNQGSL